MSKAFVALFLLVAATSLHAAFYPLHAQCELTWTFSKVKCGVVNTKIIDQIKKWSGDNCTGEGEKCKYALKSASDSQITATHTTPVHDYVDDLTMTFSNTGSSSCSVDGKSRSETWYAVLDYGTNYCNLHNLVVGSGLNNATVYGYKETTSDSDCTQYSSANCTKY